MTTIETPGGETPVAPPPPPAPSAESHATPGAAGTVATAAGDNYALKNVGDSIDNLRIKKIYAKEENAIVFESDHGLQYRVAQTSKAIDAIISEFHRVTMKAVAQLHGAYDREVDALIGAAFASAMALSDGADVTEPFKSVDRFIDDRTPVQQVFGRENGWIVYADKNGVAVLEYPELPAALTSIVGEFHRLAQLGRSSLASEEIAGLYQLLGTELAVALRTSPAPADLATAFALSRDLLKRKLEAHVRTDYTAASLVAAIVLGGVCAAIFWTDAGLLMGVTGGIIGAVISVLQRSATLEVQQFVPKSQVALQGAVRILLGILFGILLVGAARSGLALGTLAQGTNALFMFGVIAGLNERFIPDLLERVASSQNSPKSS